MKIQKGTPYVSIQEPLDDEERELMDPDNWDWENAGEGLPNPNAGAVLRLRFSREEFLALDRIAREAGLDTADFIHRTMVNLINADARAALPSRVSRAATG
jgi:hypothetical protein